MLRKGISKTLGSNQGGAFSGPRRPKGRSNALLLSCVRSVKCESAVRRRAFAVGAPEALQDRRRSRVESGERRSATLDCQCSTAPSNQIPLPAYRRPFLTDVVWAVTSASRQRASAASYPTKLHKPLKIWRFHKSCCFVNPGRDQTSLQFCELRARDACVARRHRPNSYFNQLWQSLCILRSFY